MPIADLMTVVAAELRDPGFVWQIVAIAVCAALGWGLARLARRGVGSADGRTEVVQFGVESFARVLGPSLIVIFLVVAKVIMGRWQHINLLRIALPLFGSLAVIRFGFYLLRRVFARRGPLGAALLTFEKVFALLVWLGVALYLTGMWDDVFQYLDTTVVPIGKHKVTIAAIAQALVSVAVMLMLALWAGAALEERLMHLQSMHTSLRVVLARMSRAMLIVVAVLVSLSLVGIDLTVLSVFGGALGVGLGLGLQRIASNYVSGFVILLERSLAIGDMIAVDKYYGRVTQINTRYTVLQGLDGIESVVPNELLISSAVQNYSLSNTKLRLATQFTVAYDTGLPKLLPLLEQAVLTVPRVQADPPPSACFVKFGESGFELDVGFWIADPENGRMGVLSDVNRKIWEVIESEGVVLPYPIRDVRVAGGQVAPAMTEVK